MIYDNNEVFLNYFTFYIERGDNAEGYMVKM